MRDFIVLDFETTDLNEDGDAQVVQCAIGAFIQKKYGHGNSQYFKPRSPKKISFMAMATHHITHTMVDDKDFFDESSMLRDISDHIKKGGLLIAHNAKFEVAILKNYGVDVPQNQVICTMRVAKHIFQDMDIESRSLQYLRYALGVKLEDWDSDGVLFPHDARSDVIVTNALLTKMVPMVLKSYKGDHQDAMIRLTQQPVKVKKLNFGKYKGKHISQLAYIDKQYLSRLAKNAEDEDVKYTAGIYAKW